MEEKHKKVRVRAHTPQGEFLSRWSETEEEAESMAELMEGLHDLALLQLPFDNGEMFFPQAIIEKSVFVLENEL